MREFKIGDKVRVLKTYYCSFAPVGSIQEITELGTDNGVLFCLGLGEEGLCFDISDVELVEPKKDSIVKSVRKDLKSRSKLGIEKYGVTLDRRDLSILEWHQHHYEELLDAALYTKKIITELTNKK